MRLSCEPPRRSGLSFVSDESRGVGDGGGNWCLSVMIQLRHAGYHYVAPGHGGSPKRSPLSSSEAGHYGLLVQMSAMGTAVVGARWGEPVPDRSALCCFWVNFTIAAELPLTGRVQCLSKCRLNSKAFVLI